jgi:hypothetical protein
MIPNVPDMAVSHDSSADQCPAVDDVPGAELCAIAV